MIKQSVPLFILLLALQIWSCKVRSPLALPASFYLSGQQDHLMVNFQSLTMIKPTEMGNKKVVLIDMVHVGPDAYYSRVQKIIREITESSEPSIILQEGVFYSKPKYVVANPSAYKLGQSPFSLPDPIPSDHQIDARFLTIKSNDLTELTRSGFLQLVPADRQMIPNLATYYQDIAKKNGMTMQADFPDLYPQSAKSIQGDIDLAQLPLYQQILFEMHLGCYIMELPSCQNTPLYSYFYQHPQRRQYLIRLADKIIEQTREMHLLAKIQALHQAGNPTLILPWGTDHTSRLYNKLAENGYTLHAVQSNTFASCQKLISKPFQFSAVHACKNINRSLAEHPGARLMPSNLGLDVEFTSITAQQKTPPGEDLDLFFEVELCGDHHVTDNCHFLMRTTSQRLPVNQKNAFSQAVSLSTDLLNAARQRVIPHEIYGYFLDIRLYRNQQYDGSHLAFPLVIQPILFFEIPAAKHTWQFTYGPDDLIVEFLSTVQIQFQTQLTGRK